MAPIEIRFGLPFVTVSVFNQGHRLDIPDVLLDTGAAASVFRTDDLAALGVIPMPADSVRFMSGIGGREAVIEKSIEQLSVGTLMISPMAIQLGAVKYGYGIGAYSA